jgi:hypothetical protein
MQKISKSIILNKINKSISVFAMMPVFALSGVGMTSQTISLLSVPFLSATNTISTTSTTTVGIFPEIVNFKETLEKKEDAIQAAKIDKYFASYNLPLAGYGKNFVETSDKYNLDWRLLAAIAMRESTGGKFSCPYGSKNVFGWHSCKTYFKTYEEAIDKVGQHLAGEVKSTAGYYKNKTIPQKLKRYNSVIPDYTQDIYSIMAKIENQKVNPELALNK